MCSRGSGEALSIRQMVAAAVERFGSDPKRIYIAGLSAGGAMAAAMLAAYPDVFAAGAVVAGLPVGAANGISEALRRMAEAGPSRSPAGWADLVRRAAPAGFPGPWPRLSIWHGDSDRVVDPANGRLLAEQWSALHGLADTGVTVEPSGGRREVWGPSKLPASRALDAAWPAPRMAGRRGQSHDLLLGVRIGLTPQQAGARTFWRRLQLTDRRGLGYRWRAIVSRTRDLHHQSSQTMRLSIAVSSDGSRQDRRGHLGHTPQMMTQG